MTSPPNSPPVLEIVRAPHDCFTGYNAGLLLSLNPVHIAVTQHFISVSSVQSLSTVRLFATPWTAAHQASLFITNSRSLLKLMSHPIISSSITPFSSCLQFFPAAGSFPMNQPFASGGQSIGASVSTSVLPMNSQD